MDLEEDGVTLREDAVRTRDRGSSGVNAIERALIVKEMFYRLMRFYVLMRSNEEISGLHQ